MSSRIAIAVLALALTVIAIGQADDPPKLAATKVEPKRLTLKGPTTLGKAIEAIQQQCDIAIDFTRADSSRDIKLDLDKSPFWTALEQIAKESDHRIAFSAQGRRIHLVNAEGTGYRQMPLTVDGLFRVVATRVTATHDIEQDKSICEVVLDLFWEPEFYAFLVEPPAKDVTARDNTDKQLEVAEPGKGRLGVSGGKTQMSVRLTDVPRSARTIKSLEGKFSVVGATKMLKFAFAKTSEKDSEQEQEGVKARVRTDFKEKGELWTARVSLEYPSGGPELESFEAAAWISENECWLESADGKKKLEVNGGLEVVDQTDRRAVINYRWVPDGDGSLGKSDDWKVVIRTPAKLVEIPVAFKLENIPLP